MMPGSASGKTTTLQLLKRAKLHITVCCHHHIHRLFVIVVISFGRRRGSLWGKIWGGMGCPI